MVLDARVSPAPPIDDDVSVVGGNDRSSRNLSSDEDSNNSSQNDDNQCIFEQNNLLRIRSEKHRPSMPRTKSEQQKQFNSDTTQNKRCKQDSMSRKMSEPDSRPSKMSKQDSRPSKMSKQDGMSSKMSKQDGVSSKMSKQDGVSSKMFEPVSMQSKIFEQDSMPSKLSKQENIPKTNTSENKSSLSKVCLESIHEKERKAILEFMVNYKAFKVIEKEDKRLLVRSCWNFFSVSLFLYRSIYHKTPNRTHLACGTSLKNPNDEIIVRSNAKPTFSCIFSKLLPQVHIHELCTIEMLCLMGMALFNPSVENLKNVATVSLLHGQYYSRLEEYINGTIYEEDYLHPETRKFSVANRVGTLFVLKLKIGEAASRTGTGYLFLNDEHTIESCVEELTEEFAKRAGIYVSTATNA